MMTRFVFDIDKAVAAAAYVTRKKKGARISIFELLKTMYAGEREALAALPPAGIWLDTEHPDTELTSARRT